MYRVIGLFLFLSLCCCFPNWAQVKADKQSSGISADTTRVHALLRSAQEYSDTNPQEGLSRCRAALKLAQEQQYPKGMAESYLLIADMQLKLERGDSVRIFCDKAIQLFKNMADYQGVANALTAKGLFYFLQGDYQMSDRQYQQALHYFDSLNDQKGIALIHNSFGTLHWARGNLTKALSYYHEAAAMYERIEFIKGLANVENNIGLIYLDLQRDSLALQHFLKTLAIDSVSGNELGKIISYTNLGETYRNLGDEAVAMAYFQKALKLSRTLGDQEGVATALKDIGLLKLRNDHLSEGEDYLMQALTIFESIQNKEGIAFCMSEMANLYLRRNELEKALHYASQCFQFAKQLDSKLLLSGSSFTLSGIYRQKKMFDKAFSYLELHRQYKDSLLNTASIQKIEELRFSFQLEKKEIENEKLRQEKALQEAQAEKQTLFMFIIGAGLLLAIILVVFLWIINHGRKKTNQTLTRQKAHIEQQNGSLAALNDALTAINYKLAETDREKDGLMSIVAHDLKAPLNRTQGAAQLIRLAGPLNKEQQNYLDIIEKVVEDGGNLIGNLLTLDQAQQAETKAAFTEIRMDTWLESLLKPFQLQAEKKHITLHYQQVNDSCSIRTDEKALTRILDNLISNALKFTRSGKNIYITSACLASGVTFTVQDEGPGISQDDQQKMFRKFQKLSAQPTQGENSTGLGLAIVKALTEKIGAEISVQSEVGKGTSFVLFIPF